MNFLTIVSSVVLVIAIVVLVVTVGLYVLGKIRDIKKSRKRTAPLGEATDWAPVFLKAYQPHPPQDGDATHKAPQDKT
jgi:uncharacterized membrane protein (UPF0182 family)